MKEIISIIRYDIWSKILTITSLGLVIAGFVLPPLAVIDNSVLIATGEIAGFGALWETAHAIDKGLDAKVKIKDIELQISNDEIKKKELELKELDEIEEIHDEE